MKRIVIAALLLAACGDEPTDTPEVVARKAECRVLEAHIFRIASQSNEQFDNLDDASAQKLAESMADKLPPEDIDQCVAAEPDIVKCMTLAPDVRHVRACIPADDMLACMGKYTDEHDKRHNCGYRYKGDTAR